MYETILLEKLEEGIVKLTLNRPDRLNAITRALTREVVNALDEVGQDAEARVLILTGAGRGFCAGADLKEAGDEGSELMRGRARERDLGDQGTGRRYGSGAVVRELVDLEIPTIAMVNGPAAGGGFGFALACDMRTGSENARFINSFIRLGLAGIEGLWFLPRFIGISQAARYLYTSEPIEAEEAYRLGLLNVLAPAAELEAATMDLARSIARSSPIAVRLNKIALHRSIETSWETFDSLMSGFGARASASEDSKEALAAFMEKRTPVFKGK